MRLVSLAKRDGSSVCELYGAAFDGRAVRVGLIFVRAGQKKRTLVFRNPATRQRIKLELPATALGLKADGYAKNLSLKVVHDDEATE